MPQLPAHPDPFDTTGDPRRYVPRPATERVLSELLRRVDEAACAVVLSGAPGTGKTMTLRLLGQRVGPALRSLYLPYAALPAPALCAWALDSLGESTSYDPVGALVAYAGRPDEAGEGLVLLIDNGEAIVPDTARELERASQESGRALRLVAAAEESGAAAVLAAWPSACVVAAAEPLTLEETGTYLAAHLGGLAPEISQRAGFDADVVAEVHRASGGVPARINALASRRLLRALRTTPRTARPTSEPAPRPPEPTLPPPEPEPPAAPGAGPRSSTVPGLPPLPPPPAWAVEEDEAADRAAAAAQGPASREPASQEPPALDLPERAGGPSEEDSALETDAEPSAEDSAPGTDAEPSDEDSAPGTDAEPSAEDSALERAAGRLALAHSPGGLDAPSDAPEPGFERAMGRLALSGELAAETPPTEAEPEPPPEPVPAKAEAPPEPRGAEVDPDATIKAPAPPSPPPASPEPAPARDSVAAPTGGLRISRRHAPISVRTAALVVGVAFALGIGSSLLWMTPPVAEPEAPGPGPTAVEPEAPAPEVPAAATSGVVVEPPPMPPVEVGINATPWATVRVDGREVGITPLSGVKLAPGLHTFEAKLPDGSVVTREVRIDADNRFVVFP